MMGRKEGKDKTASGKNVRRSLKKSEGPYCSSMNSPNYFGQHILYWR